MNVTQRNFAMSRVAKIYYNKFKELVELDRKLDTEHKKEATVTVAEVIDAFKANTIKGVANPKLDAPCTRLDQIFDISVLQEAALVRANKVTTLFSTNGSGNYSINISFPGYKGAHSTYSHFSTKKAYDSAIALVTSFESVLDTIMLGDAAVAQVAIERAELATF